MLKVIEDAAIIKKCQAQLKARVLAATTEKRKHPVGYPGGTSLTTVYYSKPLDFWMTLDEITNRYWNCGGIGYPFSDKNLAPHVEINPPLSGIDRRIAGAFLWDEAGVLYLGHSGKVGGGKKGVSKTNFMTYYPAWSTVFSGDREEPMYIIGRLDDNDLPRRIRDFTKRSADFRTLVKHGKAPGIVIAPPAFAPEFIGTKTYSSADLVEADCNHGIVILALRAALLKRGIESCNSVMRDLFVCRDEGGMAVLFEAKTSSDTTSVYGAVGQLFFHGGAGEASQLVAVLPDDVTDATRRRLSALGVATVTFAIGDDNDVELDGLDEVVKSFE
jgi:hypothetical protein